MAPATRDALLDGAIGRSGRRQIDEAAECAGEVEAVGEAGQHPVDGAHGELITGQLHDQGHDEVEGRRGVPGVRPSFASVGQCRLEAVMAVGDHQRSRRHRGREGPGDRRIGNRPQLVHHAVVIACPYHVGLRHGDDELGQAGGQRQQPDGRRVGPRRPQQLQPVALGLGSGVLVGQDPRRALRLEADGPDHAGGLARPTALVLVAHPVPVNGGVGVPDEDALAAPRRQEVACHLVAAAPILITGQLHPHRVVRAPPLEGELLVGADHVVRRCDDVVQTNPCGPVAEGGKRLEAGHRPCVPRRSVPGNPPRRSVPGNPPPPCAGGSRSPTGTRAHPHRSEAAGPCAWKTAPVTWLLDLDGVVWLTGDPIPGAVGAVAAPPGAR